jgi:NAD(P)-dependent dehydrogenase (short-subunit alcohol dehydrogenase family)
MKRTVIRHSRTPKPAARRVVLVTGAAKGIGRACALAFADEGAHVLLGVRDRGSVTELVGECARRGGTAEAILTDVGSVPSLRKAFARIAARHERLDVLVNNVGIGAPAPFLEVEEADFADTVDVNLRGTFFASQLAARLMVKQGGGCIVNLGSQAGSVALPTESVYCMTKAGIAHLTRCMALELAPHGIRVNAVAPTFIATPGTVKWLGDRKFRRSVIERIPLGRVGQPEDVSGVVAFLASPRAGMITGETVMIDGGWTLP